MEETSAPSLACTYRSVGEDGLPVTCSIKRNICPICRQCLPRTSDSPKTSYDCPGHLGVSGWKPSYAQSGTHKEK